MTHDYVRGELRRIVAEVEGRDVDARLVDLLVGFLVDRRLATEAVEHVRGLVALLKVTVNRCRAARDGECIWEGCPQLRDGEPRRSGRHCPLDVGCQRCGFPEEACAC